MRVTNAAEQRAIQRKHVFIVNGDPGFLDFVRELFQDNDYNVTTTNFVPRTFNQVEALEPDIIIIDLVIGEQHGWELMEHLERESITRDIPVIAVSTMDDLLERARAEQERYGAERYVAKPFDVEELLEAVHQLIGPS